MITKDRPIFLKQALNYYLNQTYDNSELIIVDDSSRSCQHLIPKDERIRYIHLEQDTLSGAKLNIAIQNASGSIIQKIDDDDYYHPRFVETLSTTLLAQGHKNTIVAIGEFLVMVLGRSTLHCSGQGWFAGGTYCFFRDTWVEAPYRQIRTRTDVFFLEDHPKLARIPVNNPELYVLVRHSTNTWNRIVPEVVVPSQIDEKDVNEYFAQCTTYHRGPAEVMGSEAANFYQEMFQMS